MHARHELIATTFHRRLASDPREPFPTAATRRNVTEPKFASGTWRHENRTHAYGASTIHSAEETSAAPR